MLKKFSFCLYIILKFFDKIMFKLMKRSFLIYFYDFIQAESYRSLKINEDEVSFFAPNKITNWRLNTIFSKEPETLEWIDGFKDEGFIFWDIGANIGLYSIYNSLKYKKSTTISFEPSSSNLRILTRNISINNLENRIKVIPIPLSNKENTFQNMNEGAFIEGGALNTFGEKFNFEGKKFEPEMKYSVIGTTINYLVESKILQIPDYIKIDVDGIEHLILEGGDKVLDNTKIKSLSIEINENFSDQYTKVLKSMNEYGFKMTRKTNSIENVTNDTDFEKTFNYIFIR